MQCPQCQFENREGVYMVLAAADMILRDNHSTQYCILGDAHKSFVESIHRKNNVIAD